MTFARLGVLLVALSFLQTMTGCSTGTTAGTAGTTPVTSTLTGNWNVVGTGYITSPPASGAGPTFALSLTTLVDGSSISAYGYEQTVCSGTTGSSGATVQMSGTVAANGTFQLVEPVGYNTQIVVNGTVPASGTSTWAGTFTAVTTAGGSLCPVNISQATAFTATVVPSLSGTYKGSLLTSAGAMSTGITASLTAAQQPEAVVPVAGISTFFLPLTGTLTVSGVSCFTSGTMTTNLSSQIQGNYLLMTYAMTDGSTVLVYGLLPLPGETGIDGLNFQVSGGKCNGTYQGTFAKQ
jgi:hypothetical protein